jgi:UDP-N-acetylglucosamine 3-dehydrogenase
VDPVKRLNVAVIGTGFWGRNQARVFANLQATKLACVCDLNAAAAQNVAEQFKTQYDTDLEHVLSRSDVDAVTVCTPTTTHKQVAEKALAAGKHVLVEKPMTNTVAEANELLQLAKSKGLRIMPGHIERFNPAVSYLKNLIDRGALGKVMLLLARRVGRWPERIGDVGVVRDSAIHDVDLTRYIFGDEVNTVYAKTGSMRHRMEDYAEIVLQFRNGGTAFIDANWLTPRKTRTLVVTGSEATVQLDYITQELSIEELDKVTKPNIENKEPLTLELTHYAESILNDRPFIVNGIDGLRAVEICESILQAGTLGRTVDLPSSPSPSSTNLA